MSQESGRYPGDVYQMPGYPDAREFIWVTQSHCKESSFFSGNWECNKRHIAANLIHTHFQLHWIVLHLHCIAFALVCTECKNKQMNSAWVWHCIYRLCLGSGKWTDRAGYESETSSTVATAVECWMYGSTVTPLPCHPTTWTRKKIVGWISFYLDSQICFKFSIWNFSSPTTNTVMAMLSIISDMEDSKKLGREWSSTLPCPP